MTIPTAEEFSKNYTRLRSAMALEDITNMLTSFAALHVQAALKEASEKATCMNEDPFYSDMIDKDSILNTYPLENIK